MATRYTDKFRRDAVRIAINTQSGAAKITRTRIRLLVQPKSMRSIIAATQREQRHGSA